MDISRLTLLAISDSGFVFDPRTGHSYTVNDTGLAALRALKKGLPVAQVIANLQERYDLIGNAESDLRAFVEALTAYELSEASEQELAAP
jgi:hypothetical protein